MSGRVDRGTEDSKTDPPWFFAFRESFPPTPFCLLDSVSLGATLARGRLSTLLTLCLEIVRVLMPGSTTTTDLLFEADSWMVQSAARQFFASGVQRWEICVDIVRAIGPGRSGADASSELELGVRSSGPPLR